MRAHIKKRIGQTREKIEKLQTKIHDRERDLRRDGKGVDKVVERWEMDSGALEAELDYWKYLGKF